MIKLNKGNLLISLDTELGLGHLADEEIKKYDCQFSKTKLVIKRLIKLFNKYDVPVTWAIVGKLIETNKKCDIEDFYPQDSITESYLSENSEIFHFREIIDLISKYKNIHEIASHSYSHITFAQGNRKHHADFDLVTKDFSTALTCFQDYNVVTSSFVYPQNRPGYENRLNDFGFEVYRGKEIKWYNSLKGPIYKIAKGLDNIFPIPPLVSSPRIKGKKLVETNGHLHFAKLPFGYRKFMPWWVLKLKLYFGLLGAIYFKKTFHLWSHPYDLAFQENKHFEVLEWFIKKAVIQRKKGNLDIKTMADLKL